MKCECNVSLLIFQFLGEWYTFATLPGYFQGEGISCQRQTNGLLPDGNVSLYIVETSPAGEVADVCGYATIPDPSAPGKVYNGPSGNTTALVLPAAKPCRSMAHILPPPSIASVEKKKP